MSNVVLTLQFDRREVKREVLYGSCCYSLKNFAALLCNSVKLIFLHLLSCLLSGVSGVTVLRSTHQVSFVWAAFASKDDKRFS